MERSGLETGNGNGHQDIRQLAEHKFEEVREWSGEALGRVENFVRERPGTAMLVALGAGFVIGRLVRRG
jgi:ElaB/YqjD/DUF883 family membrane-anchored ribosome-binding protein